MMIRMTQTPWIERGLRIGEHTPLDGRIGLTLALRSHQENAGIQGEDTTLYGCVSRLSLVGEFEVWRFPLLRNSIVL